MKIVTTPMCQEILHLAGVLEFKIVNNGVYGDADVAFVLSETKIPENSQIKFVRLKLNTFTQIEDSIKLISTILNTKPLKKNLNHNLTQKLKEQNKKLKVKVYSHFLEDIARDMGFKIVSDKYDFLIYPDYLKNDIKEELDEAGERAIELPSHKNAPLNPIKRAKIRYQILNKSICTRS